MYSRYGGDSNRSVRLPEHYGGSAFSQMPTEPITVAKRESPKHFLRNGIEEKASPTVDRMMRAEATEEIHDNVLPLQTFPDVVDAVAERNEEQEKKEEPQEKEEGKPPVPSAEKKLPTFPINFEGLRRLFDGGGEGEQDRLLLLGLILLLSRSGEDADILLWLSLLLLCG